MVVDNVTIWASGEYVLNRFDNCVDTAFFMCDDVINHFTIEFDADGASPPALLAVLACQDSHIRVVNGKPGWGVVRRMGRTDRCPPPPWGRRAYLIRCEPGQRNGRLRPGHPGDGVPDARYATPADDPTPSQVVVMVTMRVPRVVRGARVDGNDNRNGVGRRLGLQGRAAHPVRDVARPAR